MRLSIAVVAGVIGLFIHSSRADDTPPAVAAPADVPTPLAVESPQEGAGLERPENRPPELPEQGPQPGAAIHATGSSVRQQPSEHSARSELLARKEAELECLQEEVDRLLEQTGQTRAVAVRLVAFEYSRASLGNRARELDALLGMCTEDSPFVKEKAESPEGASVFVRPASFESSTIGMRALGASVVDGDVQQSPLFRRLRDAGLIAIRGEPTLNVYHGRPASLHVGGAFPVPVPGQDGTSSVAMKPFGELLEVVSEVRPGRRIRLQVRFELSDRDFARTIEVAGVQVPGMINHSINTQIELKSGQTAVLSRIDRRCLIRMGVAGESGARPEPDNAANDDRELIVLVTPELLHARDMPVPMRARLPTTPDAEAAASAYHPSEEYQYYPAMPVLPRGLQR